MTDMATSRPEKPQLLIDVVSRDPRCHEFRAKHEIIPENRRVIQLNGQEDKLFYPRGNFPFEHIPPSIGAYSLEIVYTPEGNVLTYSNVQWLASVTYAWNHQEGWYPIFNLTPDHKPHPVGVIEINRETHEYQVSLAMDGYLAKENRYNYSGIYDAYPTHAWESTKNMATNPNYLHFNEAYGRKEVSLPDGQTAVFRYWPSIEGIDKLTYRNKLAVPVFYGVKKPNRDYTFNTFIPCSEKSKWIYSSAVAWSGMSNNRDDSHQGVVYYDLLHQDGSTDGLLPKIEYRKIDNAGDVVKPFFDLKYYGAGIGAYQFGARRPQATASSEFWLIVDFKRQHHLEHAYGSADVFHGPSFYMDESRNSEELNLPPTSAHPLSLAQYREMWNNAKARHSEYFDENIYKLVYGETFGEDDDVDIYTYHFEYGNAIGYFKQCQPMKVFRLPENENSDAPEHQLSLYDLWRTKAEWDALEEELRSRLNRIVHSEWVIPLYEDPETVIRIPLQPVQLSEQTKAEIGYDIQFMPVGGYFKLCRDNTQHRACRPYQHLLLPGGNNVLRNGGIPIPAEASPDDNAIVNDPYGLTTGTFKFIQSYLMNFYQPVLLNTINDWVRLNSIAGHLVSYQQTSGNADHYQSNWTSMHDNYSPVNNIDRITGNWAQSVAKLGDAIDFHYKPVSRLEGTDHDIYDRVRYINECYYNTYYYNQKLSQTHPELADQQYDDNDELIHPGYIITYSNKTNNPVAGNIYRDEHFVITDSQLLQIFHSIEGTLDETPFIDLRQSYVYHYDEVDYQALLYLEGKVGAANEKSTINPRTDITDQLRQYIQREITNPDEPCRLIVSHLTEKPASNETFLYTKEGDTLKDVPFVPGRYSAVSIELTEWDTAKNKPVPYGDRVKIPLDFKASHVIPYPYLPSAVYTLPDEEGQLIQHYPVDQFEQYVGQVIAHRDEQWRSNEVGYHPPIIDMTAVDNGKNDHYKRLYNYTTTSHGDMYFSAEPYSWVWGWRRGSEGQIIESLTRREDHTDFFNQLHPEHQEDRDAYQLNNLDAIVKLLTRPYGQYNHDEVRQALFKLFLTASAVHALNYDQDASNARLLRDSLHFMLGHAAMTGGSKLLYGDATPIVLNDIINRDSESDGKITSYLAGTRSMGEQLMRDMFSFTYRPDAMNAGSIVFGVANRTYRVALNFKQLPYLDPIDGFDNLPMADEHTRFMAQQYRLNLRRNEGEEDIVIPYALQHKVGDITKQYYGWPKAGYQLLDDQTLDNQAVQVYDGVKYTAMRPSIIKRNHWHGGHIAVTGSITYAHLRYFDYVIRKDKENETLAAFRQLTKLDTSNKLYATLFEQADNSLNYPVLMQHARDYNIWYNASRDTGDYDDYGQFNLYYHTYEPMLLLPLGLANQHSEGVYSIIKSRIAKYGYDEAGYETLFDTVDDPIYHVPTSAFYLKWREHMIHKANESSNDYRDALNNLITTHLDRSNANHPENHNPRKFVDVNDFMDLFDAYLEQYETAFTDIYGFPKISFTPVYRNPGFGVYQTDARGHYVPSRHQPTVRQWIDNNSLDFDPRGKVYDLKAKQWVSMDRNNTLVTVSSNVNAVGSRVDTTLDEIFRFAGHARHEPSEQKGVDYYIEYVTDGFYHIFREEAAFNNQHGKVVIDETRRPTPEEINALYFRRVNVIVLDDRDHEFILYPLFKSAFLPNDSDRLITNVLTHHEWDLRSPEFYLEVLPVWAEDFADRYRALLGKMKGLADRYRYKNLNSYIGTDAYGTLNFHLNIDNPNEQFKIDSDALRGHGILHRAEVLYDIESLILLQNNREYYRAKVHQFLLDGGDLEQLKNPNSIAVSSLNFNLGEDAEDEEENGDETEYHDYGGQYTLDHYRYLFLLDAMHLDCFVQHDPAFDAVKREFLPTQYRDEHGPHIPGWTLAHDNYYNNGLFDPLVNVYNVVLRSSLDRLKKGFGLQLNATTYAPIIINKDHLHYLEITQPETARKYWQNHNLYWMTRPGWLRAIRMMAQHGYRMPVSYPRMLMANIATTRIASTLYPMPTANRRDKAVITTLEQMLQYPTNPETGEVDYTHSYTLLEAWSYVMHYRRDRRFTIGRIHKHWIAHPDEIAQLIAKTIHDGYYYLRQDINRLREGNPDILPDIDMPLTVFHGQYDPSNPTNQPVDQTHIQYTHNTYQGSEGDSTVRSRYSFANILKQAIDDESYQPSIFNNCVMFGDDTDETLIHTPDNDLNQRVVLGMHADHSLFIDKITNDTGELNYRYRQLPLIHYFVNYRYLDKSSRDAILKKHSNLYNTTDNTRWTEQDYAAALWLAEKEFSQHIENADGSSIIDHPMLKLYYLPMIAPYRHLSVMPKTIRAGHYSVSKTVQYPFDNSSGLNYYDTAYLLADRHHGGNKLNLIHDRNHEDRPNQIYHYNIIDPIMHGFMHLLPMDRMDLLTLNNVALNLTTVGSSNLAAFYGGGRHYDRRLFPSDLGSISSVHPSQHYLGMTYIHRNRSEEGSQVAHYREVISNSGRISDTSPGSSLDLIVATVIMTGWGRIIENCYRADSLAQYYRAIMDRSVQRHVNLVVYGGHDNYIRFYGGDSTHYIRPNYAAITNATAMQLASKAILYNDEDTGSQLLPRWSAEMYQHAPYHFFTHLVNYDEPIENWSPLYLGIATAHQSSLFNGNRLNKGYLPDGGEMMFDKEYADLFGKPYIDYLTVGTILHSNAMRNRTAMMVSSLALENVSLYATLSDFNSHTEPTVFTLRDLIDADNCDTVNYYRKPYRHYDINASGFGYPWVVGNSYHQIVKNDVKLPCALRGMYRQVKNPYGYELLDTRLFRDYPYYNYVESLEAHSAANAISTIYLDDPAYQLNWASTMSGVEDMRFIQQHTATSLSKFTEPGGINGFRRNFITVLPISPSFQPMPLANYFKSIMSNRVLFNAPLIFNTEVTYRSLTGQLDNITTPREGRLSAQDLLVNSGYQEGAKEQHDGSLPILLMNCAFGQSSVLTNTVNPFHHTAHVTDVRARLLGFYRGSTRTWFSTPHAFVVEHFPLSLNQVALMRRYHDRCRVTEYGQSMAELINQLNVSGFETGPNSRIRQADIDRIASSMKTKIEDQVKLALSELRSVAASPLHHSSNPVYRPDVIWSGPLYENMFFVITKVLTQAGYLDDTASFWFRNLTAEYIDEPLTGGERKMLMEYATHHNDRTWVDLVTMTFLNWQAWRDPITNRMPLASESKGYNEYGLKFQDGKLSMTSSFYSYILTLADMFKDWFPSFKRLSPGASAHQWISGEDRHLHLRDGSSTIERPRYLPINDKQVFNELIYQPFIPINGGFVTVPSPNEIYLQRHFHIEEWASNEILQAGGTSIKYMGSYQSDYAKTQLREKLERCQFTNNDALIIEPFQLKDEHDIGRLYHLPFEIKGRLVYTDDAIQCIQFLPLELVISDGAVISEDTVTDEINLINTGSYITDDSDIISTDNSTYHIQDITTNFEKMTIQHPFSSEVMRDSMRIYDDPDRGILGYTILDGEPDIERVNRRKLASFIAERIVK